MCPTLIEFTFLKSSSKIVQNIDHPAKSDEFFLKVGTLNVGSISFYSAMKEEATCVDLSLHYNILVTGAQRANVGIWDLQTGKRNAELVGHSQGLTGVRILPERSIGKFLLSAPLIVTSSYDGTLRLWSGKHHVCLAFLK